MSVPGRGKSLRFSLWDISLLLLTSHVHPLWDGIVMFAVTIFLPVVFHLCFSDNKVPSISAVEYTHQYPSLCFHSAVFRGFVAECNGTLLSVVPALEWECLICSIRIFLDFFRLYSSKGEKALILPMECTRQYPSLRSQRAAASQTSRLQLSIMSCIRHAFAMYSGPLGLGKIDQDAWL